MVDTSRTYSSRRSGIAQALADKFSEIDGTGFYRTRVYETSPRLRFWDEVKNFPAVHLNTGAETREYQGGGYKDRYLSITIRCYVHEENATEALDALIEDIETVVEQNSRLAYFDRDREVQYTHQISIKNIDTDEGVLEPLGVGEIQIEVRY